MSNSFSPISKNNLDKTNSEQFEESNNPKKILDTHKKFEKLTSNKDWERRKKSVHIENRLIKLENEITSNNEFDNKIRLFRTETNAIQENLNEEKKNLQTLKEKNTSKIQNYNEFLYSKFDNDKNIRIQESNKIIKMAEENINNINNLTNKTVKDLEEKTNEKLNDIEDKLEEIKINIENETSEREEGIKLINEQIEEESKKFYNRISIENNHREDTLKKLNTMLDEFNAEFNLKIKKEKNLRNENNEKIFRFIEETCNKLDKNLGYSYI